MGSLLCRKMSLHLLVLILLAFLVASTTAVDLKTCLRNTKDRVKNRTLALGDDIFYWDDGAPELPMFSNGTVNEDAIDKLQYGLTIAGCESTCPGGSSINLYPDLWPRLLTWLVPVLLLIGNVHIPRVGRVNRFFVILHFVGDPIDSMWSLSTKAEVWNRFYRIAFRCTPHGPRREHMARALAAMFASFEELTGDMERVETELHDIMTESGTRLSGHDLDYILMETADELVDSRSNEVLRTSLVILNYLWAVLAALIPEIGGVQSSQPGGRIGTAMFVSWLVTTVLLSNTISGFTSRRTCLRIMERYYRTLKGHSRDAHYFPKSPRLMSQSTWVLAKAKAPAAILPDEDFIDSQPWNGAVYSYRPQKRLISSGSKEDKTPRFLLLLAIAPIAISSVVAFVIIYFTPTIGLGCRTMWVMGVAGGLLLSPIITWAISKIAKGKFAWYATIAKDFVVASGLIAIIILSSIGMFNTCFCWSGYYSRGSAKAKIDLDPVTEREKNLHLLYPAMVGACLALHLVVYIIMYQVMRVGGKVFRPDEDDKMTTYRHIHGLGSPSSPGGGDGDNGVELSPFQRAQDQYSRHDSQATDDGAMLLPEPAMSMQYDSGIPKFTTTIYSERSLPEPLSRTARGSDSGSFPGSVPGSVRTPSLTGQSMDFGYASPEWRGPDQPLLSPPLPPRPGYKP